MQLNETMILFFEYGRLGNQLFQYQGLKNYFPRHRLLFFGCASLQKSFVNISVNFVNIENQANFFFRIFKKILFFFSEIGIIGKIVHSKNKEFKIYSRPGLLWNIYLAHKIYFQHSECIKKIINPPIFKKKNIKIVKDWFKSKNINYKNSNLVFVHVRRGDYLYWPDLNFPAVLPLAWYNKAILNLKKKIKKPVFIIMGDDKYYLLDVFKESKNLVISKNSYELDLIIMSHCLHGILSASSFAWWGSFYAKHNKNSKYFIAPKYWAGHRSKKLFPSHFFTNWMIYL